MRAATSHFGIVSLLVVAGFPGVGEAHDPGFGLGPHTLFKGGVELHAGVLREKAQDEAKTEYLLAFKYGLTGDWTVGIAMPFVDLDGPGINTTGRGDFAVSTKYRFWRHDQFGTQESPLFP